MADGIESIFEARYQLRIYNRISTCLIYIGQPSYLRVKEEVISFMIFLMFSHFNDSEIQDYLTIDKTV